MHSTEIVAAVIAVLKGADGATHTGGLPANWFPDANDANEAPLERLEHGDYTDYVLQEEGLAAIAPAILVRGLGPVVVPELGGLGGVVVTDEIIRVVHLRTWEQCVTSAGKAELNMDKARARYAKVVGDALYNDPKKRLGVGSGASWSYPSLTSADTAGAQITQAFHVAWDLGKGGATATDDVLAITNREKHLWAIACDMNVRIQTGGGG